MLRLSLRHCKRRSALFHGADPVFTSIRIKKLSSYLKMHEFERYDLSDKEKQALEEYDRVAWGTYCLEALFGKSTRGRR